MHRAANYLRRMARGDIDRAPLLPIGRLFSPGPAVGPGHAAVAPRGNDFNPVLWLKFRLLRYRLVLTWLGKTELSIFREVWNWGGLLGGWLSHFFNHKNLVFSCAHFEVYIKTNQQI